MEPIKNLTTQPQPESSAPTSSDDKSAPNQLTERHIELLWERMAKIYGHRWVSSYGETDDGTWLSGLFDVTPDQVRAGLEKLRVSAQGWPPTLPEFRRMCLPPKLPPYLDNGASLRRLRLAKPTDWDKQREHLAEVKAILSRHA